MATQNLKRENFLPHQDLSHDPLEPKATVLSMSYADPFWLALFQGKALLEEKTLKAELGESQPIVQVVAEK